MVESEQDVIVRAARPEDRGPVLAFCLNTWSWGDYIPEVWDSWLADPRGQLLVAELAGVPVGLQHTSYPAPDEAWFQGLRVDPAFRGKGVARALFTVGIDLARQRGAKVARLFTAADNAISRRIVDQADFRTVAIFVHPTAEAEAGVGPVPEAAVPGEAEALWGTIEVSQNYRLAEGTYCVGWRCLSLTKERLAEHLAAGEVKVLRRRGLPVAVAIVHPSWDDDLWVAGIYGEHQPLARLARLLRAQAAALALKEIGMLVPDVPEVLAPLEAAGYRRAYGNTVPGMVLYEKALSPA